MDGGQGMTVFTSGDWQVDKERDITFGVFTQLVSMLASLKMEKEKEDESKKDLS